MMAYIFAIIAIPLSIFVLQESFKEKIKEYGVNSSLDFLFGMIWFFMWLLVLINGVTILVFGSTVSLTLKPW